VRTGLTVSLSNIDSRGRIYPLLAVLNPQGPDYCKALLEFSQGEPIENEEQSNRLAIAAE
jgi:DNA-directed RNA polymerase